MFEQQQVRAEGSTTVTADGTSTIRIKLDEGSGSWAARALGYMNIDELIARVGARFDVSPDEMRSWDKSNSRVVIARHVTWYIARQLTRYSWVELGRMFNRDHSTLLTAVKRLSSKMDKDAKLADTVKDLQREVSL